MKFCTAQSVKPAEQYLIVLLCLYPVILYQSFTINFNVYNAAFVTVNYFPLSGTNEEKHNRRYNVRINRAGTHHLIIRRHPRTVSAAAAAAATVRNTIPQIGIGRTSPPSL